METKTITLYDGHEIKVGVHGDPNSPIEYFYISDLFYESKLDDISGDYFIRPNAVVYDLSFRHQFPTTLTDIAEAIIHLHKQGHHVCVAGTGTGAWLALYLVQNYQECIGTIINSVVLLHPVDMGYLFSAREEGFDSSLDHFYLLARIVAYFDGKPPRVDLPIPCASLLVAETNHKLIPWTAMAALIPRVDKVIMYRFSGSIHTQPRLICDEIESFVRCVNNK